MKLPKADDHEGHARGKVCVCRCACGCVGVCAHVCVLDCGHACAYVAYICLELIYSWLNYIISLFQMEEMSLPIDKRLIAKVEEYVAEGFHATPIVRALLQTYVKKELFPEDRCPSWTNRRYFPSVRNVANIIYGAKQKAMKGKFDQDNLMANMEDWKEEAPDDIFHLSPIDEEQKTGLLFIYQSSWQRKLLSRYGDELCLLDATYRTTKYSAPLFFLCVKTNVDYAVAGLFVSQYEDTATIASALEILHKWNPTWKPRYFMVDHYEAEMNAIENTFPGTCISTYLPTSLNVDG